ncbi:FAD-dependent monooxygenase, partial [Oryzihumus sp.]|uniref:FAD-dependent monooxygenase n=1 Tax=Oryzihumus sp. TaxID=1968903 RepID=UPI002EDAA799
RDGAVEEVDCHHLVGCDGPASTVRTAAGIGWRGAAYAQEVVLADAELDGNLTEGLAHVVAGRRGLVFLFNVGERATWRLLATQPAGTDPLPFGQPGPPVPAAELQALLDTAGLPATITHVAWSARVRLQHRLATAMRRDRLYLVGDAAHAHSPAAAQGMNTGIQDATNLGWKLALAARAERHGAGTQTLLDSYERERWPVARLVLAATHATFWAEAGTDPLASLARSRLVPLGAPLIPAVLRRRRLVAEGVRLLSGFRVGYRGSPLSVEDNPVTGAPHAGDRVPDQAVTCDGRPTRLHNLTALPGTHVLLRRDAPPITHADLGQPGPAADAHPRQRPGAHQHRLSSVPGRGVLVVRPDGYVGYRSDLADPTLIRGWLVLAGECHQ